MIRTLVVCTLIVVANASVSHAAAADATWPASALTIRHSAIALMPEGTPPDYELFRPLHPTIVAWGEDGLSALEADTGREALRRKAQAFRRVGITHLACNVWMLTATERYLHDHPELATTACVDLWGNRIVPPWLADADYHGTKPWWGCTNQPRYQQHLIARLRAGLNAGADLVHLDDHSGTLACAAGAGGCFCDYCVAGFRSWLKDNIAPTELRSAGITDADRFDYRAFLEQRHYANRAAFIAETWKGQVPLWSWFLAYQRDAARAFIVHLEAEAAQIAGRPISFGVNAYNLEPKQLFDADLVDYFANEVQQFDHEDLVPPVVYRLGDTLGRPTFATGTGEDWIAYRSAHATHRVQGWIAEAYAFGQYFMYAWNKWGFSERTGTLWTQVDPAVFRPMSDFIHAHPTLFDGFENTGATALLYDNASANHNHWAVRDTSKRLLDAGIPYRLAVNGDDLLRHPLTVPALASVRTLVIPSDVVRTQPLDAVLAAWQTHGGHVVTSSGAGPIQFEAPDRIGVHTDGRVWVLPRVQAVRSANAGHGDRTSIESSAVVLHLLNRDYDAASDAFAGKQNLTLTLDPAAYGISAAMPRVRYFQPGAPDEELSVKRSSDGKIEITVPTLDIWGIVEIR